MHERKRTMKDWPRCATITVIRLAKTPAGYPGRRTYAVRQLELIAGKRATRHPRLRARAAKGTSSAALDILRAQLVARLGFLLGWDLERSYAAPAPLRFHRRQHATASSIRRQRSLRRSSTLEPQRARWWHQKPSGSQRPWIPPGAFLCPKIRSRLRNSLEAQPALCVYTLPIDTHRRMAMSSDQLIQPPWTRRRNSGRS